MLSTQNARTAKGDMANPRSYKRSVDTRRVGWPGLESPEAFVRKLLGRRCGQLESAESRWPQEYLGFLKEIAKNVPERLEVHISVDNYAPHKHPRVKRWLAARPRCHVHFTPTYASWLNQVEIWFQRITQQAIRRGTFRSVKELVEKIAQYAQNSNRQAQPFVWTATADSLFAKIQRLCERISGTPQ
jgi:transposase